MAGQLHESYTHEEEVHGSSNRGFGLTVGGILAAIGLLKGFLGSGFGTFALVLLVLGGALFLTALVHAPVLAPLNRAWTKLGLLMFKIVNPIVMFLIFAVTVVPIGLIMRARGKDLLRLKLDPDASSYWIERDEPGPTPSTMVNQF